VGVGVVLTPLIYGFVFGIFRFKFALSSGGIWAIVRMLLLWQSWTFTRLFECILNEVGY